VVAQHHHQTAWHQHQVQGTLVQLHRRLSSGVVLCP
jgi:hypothetical protein